MRLEKNKLGKMSLAASCMFAMLVISGCSSNDDDNETAVAGDGADNDNPANVPEDGVDAPTGGVFVMSNILDANTIVAYQRSDDGTLVLAGEFATGGGGGDFDGGEGLDPLISAYSLINTPDNDYLMAVNAGSNTISVMQINEDMTLELVDTEIPTVPVPTASPTTMG